jgi:hypothetical protein
VTPYAVCTVHKEMMSACFLVEPQNQGRRFVSVLASKPLGRFVSGLASKPVGRFISGLVSKSLGQFSLVWPQNRWWWFSLVWPQNQWRRFFLFWHQNRQLRFDDLGLKINATVSWFGFKNQTGYGLSVALQNRWEDETTRDTCRDLAACFTWKQVRLEFSSLASRLVEA